MNHFNTDGQTRWQDFLDAVVEPDETLQATIFGVQRWAEIWHWLPFIGHIAELFRRDIVLALTERRLLVIELRKPLFLQKVKKASAYRLREVRAIRSQRHVLSSTVTLQLEDGVSYYLRDVDREAGPALEEAFADVCRGVAR